MGNQVDHVEVSVIKVDKDENSVTLEYVETVEEKKTEMVADLGTENVIEAKQDTENSETDKKDEQTENSVSIETEKKKGFHLWKKINRKNENGKINNDIGNDENAVHQVKSTKEEIKMVTDSGLENVIKVNKVIENSETEKKDENTENSASIETEKKKGFNFLKKIMRKGEDEKVNKNVHFDENSVTKVLEEVIEEKKELVVDSETEGVIKSNEVTETSESEKKEEQIENAAPSENIEKKNLFNFLKKKIRKDGDDKDKHVETIIDPETEIVSTENKAIENPETENDIEAKQDTENREKKDEENETPVSIEIEKKNVFNFLKKIIRKNEDGKINNETIKEENAVAVDHEETAKEKAEPITDPEPETVNEANEGVENREPEDNDDKTENPVSVEVKTEKKSVFNFLKKKIRKDGHEKDDNEKRIGEVETDENTIKDNTDKVEDREEKE